jgi:hypothetical protein
MLEIWHREIPKRSSKVRHVTFYYQWPVLSLQVVMGNGWHSFIMPGSVSVTRLIADNLNLEVEAVVEGNQENLGLAHSVK